MTKHADDREWFAKHKTQLVPEVQIRFGRLLDEIARLEAERDKWLDQLDDEVVRANTAEIEVATLREALRLADLDFVIDGLMETGETMSAMQLARIRDAATPTATAREGGSDGETT